MFTLNERYEINRTILKCDYIRFSPSDISTINTPKSQKCNNILREDFVISLLKSYLEIIFYVLQAATVNRYADNNDIRLVILGPIAFFSKYKLAIFSVKHLENNEQGHIASLMYKLLTTARGCGDLSVGFDRSRDRRQRELTNNKKVKGKYHVRIYLKDIFGFAEHQLKGTYGLGYILTLAGNTDKAVLNKNNAINNAKTKFKNIHRYVPQNTPSIAQQSLLLKQIQNKIPTELQNPEKSILRKK